LIVLHNGKYEYILLSDADPKVITIPPLVPHLAVQLGEESCTVINAVIRHGRAHPSDYRPLKAPFPYDLDRVKQLTKIRGLNPPPLGGLFLGWGLNPHPKNPILNSQFSILNSQLI
jgi:hypothetical protein